MYQGSMNQSEKYTVLRGAGVVGSLTLLSRVLGFVRDLFFARLFGAGMVADAFFVAFRIPNMLRSFLAEGALTSAFVPTFSSELERGSNHAHAAIRSIMGLLLIASATLSVVGIVFARPIIALFA